MLLSFRFGNHRSFREEQQLNLLPVYDDNQESLPTDASTVVGIFGPNASGKSNVVHALSWARAFALRSDRTRELGARIDVDPFLLDGHSIEEPSRYVFDLRLDGVRFTYGFSVDAYRVHDEWLYHYPKNRRIVVFERDEDEYRFGGARDARPTLEQVAGITASEALFLPTSSRFRISATSPTELVYGWFQRFSFRYGHSPRADALLQDPAAIERIIDSRDMIVGLLRAADIGIVGLTVAEDAGPDFETVVSTTGASTRPAYLARPVLGRSRYKLMLTHQAADRVVDFDSRSESTGTIQLLDLITDAVRILKAGSATMVVDEIDASLHPLLTAQLIRLFQDPDTNPLRNQLIFTSHDTNLLGHIDGEDVLLRDEIWFTEKQRDGQSTLYPLSDFRPRKTGENRQRRYLNGNYGAIPDLSSDLFRQALGADSGQPDAEG